MNNIIDIRSLRDKRDSLPYRGFELKEGYCDGPNGSGACIDIYKNNELIGQVTLEPGKNNIDSLEWEIATERFQKVIEQDPLISSYL